jgi:N utilization substance protein A
MSNELMQALIDLEKERGIPKAALIEAIRTALNTAYKKNFGTSQNVIVEMNEITGAVQVYSQKQVVAEVKDKSAEISLDEALQINSDAQLDEIINIEITPSNFGRIAAQTAKQVVVQKLREAERSMIFEEFADREGEIVTGTVQRIESKIVVVTWGVLKVSCCHPDQISSERYEVGQRIKG